MLRLHFRHDEESTPASSPAGQYLVHRKQFLPLGGVKNLFFHGSDASLYFSHQSGKVTPGYDLLEVDLNDGALQVFKCTGDDILALKNAFEYGKNGGDGMDPGAVDFDIPVDIYGGGKMGLPWGVPFTVRTRLTSDAGTSKTQRIGWELHKPDPRDIKGNLGLKYMPRYVKTNANLSAGVDERPYEFTTGQNLVIGLSLPMLDSDGIQRIQIFTPADGRVVELKREEIITSQRRYWDVDKYDDTSGKFFFRFPEPWILPAGSKMLVDCGSNNSADDEITPLEMVGLEGGGTVDMAAISARA